MKKKLVYTFLSISVLLIFIYILRYKQALVFTNRVPQTATAIININTRQLEHHLLVDILSHPITYLESDTKNDGVKKQKFTLTKGVQIPKNVLFFTNSTSLKNNWFSSVFEVNDTDELSKYLITKKFKKNNFENDVIYSKDAIAFVLRNNQLIIAFKSNRQIDIVETAQSVFNETNFLSDTSAILKPIIDSKNDICFTTIKNDFVEASFKKGILEIQGETNPDFDLFITTLQPEFTQN